LGIVAPFSVTLPVIVTVFASKSSVLFIESRGKSHISTHLPASQFDPNAQSPQDCPHLGSTPHSNPPHAGAHTQPDVSNVMQLFAHASDPVPAPSLSHVAPPRSVPSHASTPSFWPLPHDAGPLQFDESNPRQFSWQPRFPVPSPTPPQVCPPKSAPSHVSTPLFIPSPQLVGAPHADESTLLQSLAHDNDPAPKPSDSQVFPPKSVPSHASDVPRTLSPQDFVVFVVPPSEQDANVPHAPRSKVPKIVRMVMKTSPTFC
jgi:hypothetical protein